MTNIYLTNLYSKPRKVRAKAKEGSLGILAFTKHYLPSHDHNDGSWKGLRVLVRFLNFQVVSRLHSTKKKTLPTSHQIYYVSHHDHWRDRGPNLVFKGAATYPLVQDHRGHHHSWQGPWVVEPHMVVKQSTASWGYFPVLIMLKLCCFTQAQDPYISNFNSKTHQFKSLIPKPKRNPQISSSQIFHSLELKEEERAQSRIKVKPQFLHLI